MMRGLDPGNSLNEIPWRKDIPLIQGEQISFDMGKAYGDDDLNLVTLTPEPFPRGGVFPGPLLLTNYRLIHMLRVSDKRLVKKFFRSEVKIQILGCSLNVGIPWSHIDRMVFKESCSQASEGGGEMLEAYFLAFLAPDFQEKYSGLQQKPREISFDLVDWTEQLPTGTPTPAVRAKRIVDEGNKILAGYVSGILAPCKYCKTPLKKDMIMCSYCGAPVSG